MLHKSQPDQLSFAHPTLPHWVVILDIENHSQCFKEDEKESVFSFPSPPPHPSPPSNNHLVKLGMPGHVGDAACCLNSSRGLWRLPALPGLGCLRPSNRGAQALSQHMGGGSRSTFPRWLLFQGAKASATRLSLNPVSGTLAYAWGGGGGGGKD